MSINAVDVSSFFLLASSST